MSRGYTLHDLRSWPVPIAQTLLQREGLKGFNYHTENHLIQQGCTFWIWWLLRCGHLSLEDRTALSEAVVFNQTELVDWLVRIMSRQQIISMLRWVHPTRGYAGRRVGEMLYVLCQPHTRESPYYVWKCAIFRVRLI
jgi:hypothetical protein